LQKQPKPAAQRGPFIASLSHGLAVLEAVVDSNGDIPLAALASSVHLNKTTTWRLAHTLVRLGYLRQDEKTRRFKLAPRVLALGHAYLEALDLRELANPFLRDLSTRVNEMVNLAILHGDELVFIDRIRTSQIVSVNLHPGSRLPLYNTSLGRVLISEMPMAWLRQYMSHLDGDPKATRYIQDGGKKLLLALKEVRDKGYALSDNERVEGLRAVAAPVRERGGKIVAALNVLVPSVRVTASELRENFAPAAMETASEISAALGFKWRQWRSGKAGQIGRFPAN
jgi:IclR family transcriptional regulator, pca regulon regulatory protein